MAHFLDKYKKDRAVRIDRRALARLSSYEWPGNIRQLENEIQRALVVADDVIREEHLSMSGSSYASTPEPASDLDLRSHEDALARRLIRRAFDEADGNQTRAAELLGLSRFGLQKMIKRLGIET